MKKTFELIDLDCAHCAARMEAAIRKLDGVTSASVNFLTQRLTIEGDDACFDRITEQTVGICSKIEPDCKIVVR